MLRDLELLLRSRYGLIFLRTAEEDRATSLLRHLADKLGVPFFVWTRSQGVSRDGKEGATYDTKEAVKALRHVSASPIDGLYQFLGLSPAALTDELTQSVLRDAARALEGRVGAVVITGADMEPPASISGIAADLSLPGPDQEELRELLANLIRDLDQRGHVDVSLSKEEEASLLRHLRGLTLLEAHKILTKAIIEDGRLTAEDIQVVVAAKKEVVEREGLLEYFPTDQKLAQIADLASLKEWLAKRQGVVREPTRAASYGLQFPRGMLLLGVPGCGKSLSAKAVASEWGLPLLKLDPSNLYNKYIGESERNFKRAMRAAERMAPVVLWIDELEKAFASGGEDGGVSQRILGSFLSWMQDRRGDVFIVATANDVQKLPPEFLRKGRFDEIFFVDLPNLPTRREVFRIHLKGRGQDPELFDLDVLARITDGFSGSEIEGVVVAGLYSAFATGGTLAPHVLIEEAGKTRPLSVTRSEEIAALRAWARERTVPAN